MRKLILAAAVLACACGKPAPEKRKVLLIGNSFTSANAMPATLASLAESLGDGLEVAALAPGGYTFEQHSADKATAETLRARNWDFVVLQEQSQRPAWPERFFNSMVLPYALHLDELVRADAPLAKTVFFATWGYRDGDAANCKAEPGVCSYAGMQKRLDSAYAGMAYATNAVLAPAGKAWAEVRNSHPEIELYAQDGIHPSREGSYLAACSIYAAITGKNPSGGYTAGLPQETAAVLQAAAYRATQPQ